MASADGVPSYPGSLRVSGTCPPWDNGRDGGSDLAKAMLAMALQASTQVETLALPW